ncbi:14465_t:CDS:2 [Cetraspora pellucida]|uniref:14465_t:CDS:1 n=1 Tax=Cetraspora pellucida TaxID=1433469 RepID=A0A9N9N368_9GLOM|nr:14465_t:CDS:2 [Cetraspora pellucida]
MGQLKSQNKHLKKIRDLWECDQIKKIQTIINNPSILLDYLISKFLQLNNNDFSILIKKILESRKINTFIQKQLLNYLIPLFEYINDDNFNSMIKKIIESREMDAGAQRKSRTKQLKQRQVSKIHSSICKTKKIWPVQFCHAANKLFKINKKEYNVSFVKLATDISNIRQTSIYATVECTRAIYQFLTEEMS